MPTSNRDIISAHDKSSVIRGTGEAKFHKARAASMRRRHEADAILESIDADGPDDDDTPPPAYIAPVAPLLPADDDPFYDEPLFVCSQNPSGDCWDIDGYEPGDDYDPVDPGPVTLLYPWPSHVGSASTYPLAV